VVVGGGHLDLETGRAARALGWPVLASYGMTEAASQIATQDFSALEQPYEPAPIPLLPIWRTRLWDDDRLEITGPALFSGTLVKTDDDWRYIPRGGEWHLTDDRVALEGDMLTPLGRADSRVKVLGELVDPGEIERALVDLSGGRLAPGSVIVVPVPDERTGHALVPVFDMAADRDAVREVLHAHAATAAGPWRLREPVFPDRFPCGALGKPQRAEIASLAIGQAMRRAATPDHGLG
jgi:O-succinylbenzoic acid--CoA ligase